MFREVPRLICLGVALDACGSTTAQVEHRLDFARARWHRHRAMLLSHHVPPSDRYRFFRATVGSSLLHGAGNWVPSAHVRAQLELTEMRYLRQMTKVRKAPEEDWVPFYRRRHKLAQAFREEATSYLWHSAVTAAHGWYGHVHRHWRSLEWWRTVQFLRGPRDLAGRHPRRGWHRAVEHLLEGCYGGALSAQLATREQWLQARPAFVEFCVHSFGGRLPERPRAAKRRRGAER